MIHDSVSVYTDPINEFIFSHLYIICVILLSAVSVIIIGKIRSRLIGKRAERLEPVNTNEWFKIEK